MSKAQAGRTDTAHIHTVRLWPDAIRPYPDYTAQLSTFEKLILWWSARRQGDGHRRGDVFPASVLPAPGPRGAPAGRLPGCPIIKPNDSICALFNFDVPVMYYTIRLIWQFPLRLIKYLWSEVDDKSYQRAIVRMRLTRHIHQHQQSGPLALAY